MFNILIIFANLNGNETWREFSKQSFVSTVDTYFAGISSAQEHEGKCKREISMQSSVETKTDYSAVQLKRRFISDTLSRIIVCWMLT